MLKSLLTRTIVPAAALLALSGCVTTDAATSPRAQPGPALWKVADKDTTIYLFGTVHVLPETTTWYDARIATALESAGSIVTELPASAMTDPASQQIMMSAGMLPQGETLRALLSEEQRTRYEAALAKLEVPPQAFDPFEPWLAGMTLSLLPLLKSGWKAEKGVEKVLESKAGPNVERGAVETLEGQLKMFDELPRDVQVAFLMSAVDNTDKVVLSLNAMVDAWKVGDADRLAALMNEGLDDDPGLAERLLYARNRTWAKWIDDRLDTPGTVFMAVGAGHLAGKQSVQDALKTRGIKSKRIR